MRARDRERYYTAPSARAQRLRQTNPARTSPAAQKKRQRPSFRVTYTIEKRRKKP